jgi:hypothetical protein
MKTLCLIALLGASASSWGQGAASQPPAGDSVEEIVVPGSRPENLRLEIERLEIAVYDRWNSLNSNDEFDIQCLEREPTGSNITMRTCAPKFVIDAESREARGSVRESRAGGADARNLGEVARRMEEKSRALTEEMQRVARADEQLLRDLVRLDELRQLQATDRDQRRPSR